MPSWVQGNRRAYPKRKLREPSKPTPVVSFGGSGDAGAGAGLGRCPLRYIIHPTGANAYQQ